MICPPGPDRVKKCFCTRFSFKTHFKLEFLLPLFPAFHSCPCFFFINIISTYYKHLNITNIKYKQTITTEPYAH